MKYWIALTFVCVISVNKSYAQMHSGSIGFQIGPNIGSLRGDVDEDELKSLTGINTGLSLLFYFSEKVALKTGFYYETKGARRDINVINDAGVSLGNYEFRDIFKYLTVPVLLHYAAPGKVSIFANGGIYAAYCLEKTLVAYDIPEAGDVNINQSDKYKNYEFGLALGAGISVDLGPSWNFLLEIRDNVGITNILELEGTIVCTNTMNFLPGLIYNF